MEDKQRIIFFAGALLLLIMVKLLWKGSPGDHPPMGEVTGRITMDGKPLSGVMVAFFPQTGRPSTGVADADGRYLLKYTRQISGSKVGPSTVHLSWETGASGPAIPERYGLNKSELTADVKPGDNVFDFAIESSPSDSKGAASVKRESPVIAD